MWLASSFLNWVPFPLFLHIPAQEFVVTSPDADLTTEQGPVPPTTSNSTAGRPKIASSAVPTEDTIQQGRHGFFDDDEQGMTPRGVKEQQHAEHGKKSSSLWMILIICCCGGVAAIAASAVGVLVIRKKRAKKDAM
jgi:hypothetical protein